MKLPKIRSDFALLDVKSGRKNLSKRMPAGFKRLPDAERIPVVIRGFISNQFGRDDGISIEFTVDVVEVEISEPQMATGRQIKVGRGSVKDGKFKPSDSTSRPLRKGKHAKADRAAKAWLKKSQKAKP